MKNINQNFNEEEEKEEISELPYMSASDYFAEKNKKSYDEWRSLLYW